MKGGSNEGINKSDENYHLSTPRNLQLLFLVFSVFGHDIGAAESKPENKV